MVRRDSIRSKFQTANEVGFRQLFRYNVTPMEYAPHIRRAPLNPVVVCFVVYSIKSRELCQ